MLANAKKYVAWLDPGSGSWVAGMNILKDPMSAILDIRNSQRGADCILWSNLRRTTDQVQATYFDIACLADTTKPPTINSNNCTR